MENGLDSMKNNYNANLKAKTYNEKFNRLATLITRNFEFMLQFLHDVVESGRFEGTKVLEIGSGATVHNIASASSRYSSIVQSDYVVDNCEELRRWLRDESTLDWTRFLDMVLKVEGKESCSAVNRSELEARIRSSVKCVVRGDLLSDQVLPLEELTPDTSPPYDLVITVLCIETVAQDFDGYVAILKRINTLLRTGGGLVVCGYENGSPWNVGKNIFHHVKLTMGQITDAFKKAGFGISDVRTLAKIESDYDCSAVNRSELEARIRSSVKCVVRGDLLSDQVLPLEELTPDTSPPYDLVITVLCIETVAQDFDGYVAILKRINTLLRTGGGLVVCGYENGSPWNVGKNIFHHVKLTMGQITDAFKKAGFGISDVRTLAKIESDYDCSAVNRSELEARIRSSVKCVVRGDLLSDQVLPLEELTPDTSPPYDLVITVLCIETVAQDFDGYVAILKRINTLLRTGGGLVVCGYENGSPWNVGKNIFHHVKLTMGQITDAFKKAGFGISDVRTLAKIESDYEYDYDNLFCIAAEKL